MDAKRDMEAEIKELKNTLDRKEYEMQMTSNELKELR